MKILPLLTMVPALSMAGQISGKVSDLDGRPLAGVEVQGRHESDISKPSGAWTVGMALGYAPKKSSSNGRPSSLSLHDRRLELSWTGHDLKGRRNPRGVSPRVHLSALRTAQVSSPETLWVFWKGKRLAQVPLNSDDTSGVKIRIDTAWSDDGGIPWNSKVSYGSLRDDRTRHTYRTIEIGHLRWMAEDLRSVPNWTWMGYDIPPHPWEVLNVPPTPVLEVSTPGGLLFNRGGFDSTGVDWVCPEEWRVPSQQDLWEISRLVGECPSDGDPVSRCPADSLRRTGNALRSTSGWPAYPDGGDPFGFRLLPVAPANLTAERNASIPSDPGASDASGGFWLADTWRSFDNLQAGSKGGLLFLTNQDGRNGLGQGQIRPTNFRSFDFAPIRCVQTSRSAQTN